MSSKGAFSMGYSDSDREDVRPTGHMGGPSAVAWAKAAAEESGNTISHEPSIALQVPTPDIPSYHTEDADFSYNVNEDSLNIFEWPDLQLAHELVNNYFQHVHNAFPILDKMSFEAWYIHAKPSGAPLNADETIWLGTLNLIFAIAAYHAHLTDAEYRGSHYDHLVYYARAKKLCMDQRLLYQDAQLSTVGAMGLQCLYNLATCNLNR